MVLQSERRISAGANYMTLVMIMVKEGCNSSAGEIWFICGEVFAIE
jgi:hypothetical protein